MNRKFFFAIASTALMAIGIAGNSTAEGRVDTTPKTEIIIGAAASLTEAMNEIIGLYKTENPELTVTPTYASSGSLQKQIEQGAPIDVFFSAAAKQMTDLSDKGLILEGTKKDMLENTVVLITPKSKKKITSFEDAGTDKIKQIAIGEPKSVPAGQYAEQIFTYLKMWNAVSAKAVFAKDVRQVLTYIEAGEVDAGIVYATDAAIAKNVRVAAIAPKGSHAPVVYPAAVIKGSANPEAAKAFLAWLSSPKAAAVFTRYGFVVLK